MVELYRYAITCPVFPEGRRPFDHTFTYLSKTREKNTALEEFFTKIAETEIWCRNDIPRDCFDISGKISDPLLEDIIEITNEPRPIFRTVEEATERFLLKDDTTQILVWLNDVYTWRSGTMTKYSPR